MTLTLRVHFVGASGPATSPAAGALLAALINALDGVTSVEIAGEGFRLRQVSGKVDEIGARPVPA